MTSEWQPIATAPKDGTDVLLCGYGYLPVVAGWFHNGEEGGWASDERPDRWIDMIPTHWLRIPPPPAS